MGEPNLEAVTERFVVVGVDGSESSLHAVDWASDEARYRGAELRVVHVRLLEQRVMENALVANEVRRESAIVRTAVERAQLRSREVVVNALTVDPPTAESLIQASIGAELLVVGSRGLNRMEEILLGSVSRECVVGAHCSVLVVRNQWP
ncbi:MAG TPA: universal stress protein [Acidimicrobiales bacterium]|nr:universal stress protein [Acidimicrobiales bacterium]